MGLRGSIDIDQNGKLDSTEIRNFEEVVDNESLRKELVESLIDNKELYTMIAELIQQTVMSEFNESSSISKEDFQLLLSLNKRFKALGIDKRIEAKEDEKEKELVSYFGISKEYPDLKKTLDDAGLSIVDAMEKFHNYIEQELQLTANTTLSSQEYSKLIGNVKSLISFKIKDLPKQINEISKGESANKYLINSILVDSFSDINKTLLASAKFYVNMYDDKYKGIFEETYGSKTNPGMKTGFQLHALTRLKDIKETLIDNSITSGEIPNGLMYNDSIVWRFFDQDGYRNDDILTRFNPEAIDAQSGRQYMESDYCIAQASERTKLGQMSFLDSEGQKQESHAQMCFLGATLFMCSPWAGAVVGAAVDFTDIFSSKDSTIVFLKKFKLVDQDYEMPKYWYDNMLAVLGLAAGIVGGIVGLNSLRNAVKIPDIKRAVKATKGAEGFGQVLHDLGKVFGIDSSKVLKWFDGKDATRAANADDVRGTIKVDDAVDSAKSNGIVRSGRTEDVLDVEFDLVQDEWMEAFNARLSKPAMTYDFKLKILDNEITKIKKSGVGLERLTELNFKKIEILENEYIKKNTELLEIKKRIADSGELTSVKTAEIVDSKYGNNLFRNDNERFLKDVQAKERLEIEINEFRNKDILPLRKEFWLGSPEEKGKLTTAIDNIIANADPKLLNMSEAEIAKMGQTAHKLMEGIVENKGFSNTFLDLMGDVGPLLTKQMERANIKSLNHTLEAIIGSSKIPLSARVESRLAEFGNISQAEFMGVISIFHDLQKSYMPAQFIPELRDIMKGMNLTSHQFDSAQLLKRIAGEHQGFYNKMHRFLESSGVGNINHRNTIIEGFLKLYKSFIKYLDSKGIYFHKQGDFIDLMSDIIKGHAGNTEFIQVDTARAGKRLIDGIAGSNITEIRGKTLELLTDAQKIDFNKEVRGIKDSEEYRMSCQKFVLQKYLEKNLGKKIKMDEIDIQEYKELVATLNSTVKNEDIAQVLSKGDLEGVDSILDSKTLELGNMRTLLNKYGHGEFGDAYREHLRFMFNLNDISGYAKPNSEGFIKLIGLEGGLDVIIASPMNSSFAVLSEINHKMTRICDSGVKDFGKQEELDEYTKMLEIGTQNIKKFVETYSKKLTEPFEVGTNAPSFLQRFDGKGSSFGEVYRKMCDFSKNKGSLGDLEADFAAQLPEIKNFFVNEFKEMCQGMEGMKDLY